MLQNWIIANATRDCHLRTYTATIDHCASDDVVGTNAVDISPGAVEADDWD